MTNRTIIIGDVHGCYTELQELLTKLAWNKNSDRLIFCGDLINRGPNSLDCFLLFKKAQAEAVLGNHEYYLLEAFTQNKDWDILHRMKAEFKEHFADLIESIKKWPLSIKINSAILMHAGFDATKPLASNTAETITNIREVSACTGRKQPWFEAYNAEPLLIFGHWSRLGGVIRKNVIGLDLGCVYGGQLCALILPERRIVKVNAKKKYWLPEENI